MHVQEPAIKTAAALTLHWERRDIEAVVIMLTEIQSQDEAEDIIIALLNLRGRPITDVHKLVLNA